jgi:Zn-dependent M28 family amino/carboxypeptidase
MIRLNRVLLASTVVVASACSLNPAPGHRSSIPASITEAGVRSELEFLAGDALNGRGSGTRDEWIAASYIGTLMQQWGLEPVGQGFVQQIELPPDAKTTTRQTWNAVGRLPGRDPVGAQEVILLSAHLDHLGNRPPREGTTNTDTIYNGADDDASGCVAVLQLAHALAMGPRLRRTMVFAFFGSEERGGFGSRYFADHPVVALKQIVANLQFEMIGRPDPKVAARTLWLTGYERSTLGPALAKEGARLVQDPHPEQNFFFRSDNIEFARRGVVAHTVSSYGLHKDYHQPSDDVTKIDVPHMVDAIQSLLAPIRWLANSTFAPQWLPGKKP